MRVRRRGEMESRRRAEVPPVTEAQNKLPTVMDEDFIDTQESQPGLVTQEGGSVTGHDLHSILDEVKRLYTMRAEKWMSFQKRFINIYLNAEDIAMYLGAGYTMEELQGIRGVELEVDDTPPVELELSEVDGHPYLNDDDDADLGGDEAEKVPMPRKRKPSEMIIKNKLKKAVFDKDGGGSSASNPVSLE
ncbi:hypothetical protein LXL04_015385 [Taraxacum kok-saghyz]